MRLFYTKRDLVRDTSYCDPLHNVQNHHVIEGQGHTIHPFTRPIYKTADEARREAVWLNARGEGYFMIKRIDAFGQDG